MLSSAHIRHTGFKPLGGNEGGYPHHPCTLWAGDSTANYKWLYNHMCALLDEFKWRRRGRLEHDYERMRKAYSVVPPISEHKPTTVALAMPDEFKRKSPVKSYRLYYKYDKQVNIKFMYTRRLRPEWL